jgi:hypothetical protein
MNLPLQRVQVAEEVLSLHPAALDCKREETVTHLLSDLMHHCAAVRLDFDTLLSSARQLHRQEVEVHCYFAD